MTQKTEKEPRKGRQKIVDVHKKFPPKPALASHGENQHSGGVDNVNSTQGGNDASYALRRLKRDHPNLSHGSVLPTRTGIY